MIWNRKFCEVSVFPIENSLSLSLSLPCAKFLANCSFIVSLRLCDFEYKILPTKVSFFFVAFALGCNDAFVWGFIKEFFKNQNLGLICGENLNLTSNRQKNPTRKNSPSHCEWFLCLGWWVRIWKESEMRIEGQIWTKKKETKQNKKNFVHIGREKTRGIFRCFVDTFSVVALNIQERKL